VGASISERGLERAIRHSATSSTQDACKIDWAGARPHDLRPRTRLQLLAHGNTPRLATPRTPTTTGHGSPVSAHRAAHAGERLTAPEPHEDETSMTSHIREQAKLITAQLLSGAGIASGYALGGLLAEEITGQTA